MEDKDFETVPENNEQSQKSEKLPFVMLAVLAVLVVILIAGVAGLVQDITEKVSQKTSSQPMRAFQKEKPYRTSSSEVEQSSNYSEPRNYKQLLETFSSEPVALNIGELESYNGLSKREIYDIRTKHVKQSIFYEKGYKPSEEVFGRIEDGKSWWGVSPCSFYKGDTIRGDSSLSRYINTPDLLISTYFPFNMSYYGEYKKRFGYLSEYCNSEFAKLIPTSLVFTANDNTITANYAMTDYILNHRLNHYDKKDILYPIAFSGLNARDFGYEYIKITNMDNARMLYDENAYKDVYRFQDYIHVGGSCKQDGGCNNWSPRQPELEFYLTALPASVQVKLWKKAPMFPNLHGDINFVVNFYKE